MCRDVPCPRRFRQGLVAWRDLLQSSSFPAEEHLPGGCAFGVPGCEVAADGVPWTFLLQRPLRCVFSCLPLCWLYCLRMHPSPLVMASDMRIISLTDRFVGSIVQRSE